MHLTGIEPAPLAPEANALSIGLQMHIVNVPNYSIIKRWKFQELFLITILIELIFSILFVTMSL